MMSFYTKLFPKKTPICDIRKIRFLLYFSQKFSVTLDTVKPVRKSFLSGLTAQLVQGQYGGYE